MEMMLTVVIMPLGKDSDILGTINFYRISLFLISEMCLNDAFRIFYKYIK